MIVLVRHLFEVKTNVLLSVSAVKIAQIVSEDQPVR